MLQKHYSGTNLTCIWLNEVEELRIIEGLYVNYLLAKLGL